MNGETKVDTVAELEALRKGIRRISHEISNPLGVLRMSTYFLESTSPTPEKRLQYFKAINDSLTKIEATLHEVRFLLEKPVEWTSANSTE